MKALLFQNLTVEGYVTKTVLSDLFAFVMSSFILYKVIIPFTTHYLRLQRTWLTIGGPKPHWLYGHLDKYQYNAEGLRNSVLRCREFPKMAMQWLGPVFATVHLYHPDVLQAVLSKSYPKPIDYSIAIGRLFRGGLVTSSGSTWKRHRKLLTPAFHFDIFKNHIPVFNDSVHRMIDYLDAKTDNSGGLCDITTPINSLSYENTMRCVFSQKELQWEDRTFSDCIGELNYLCISRLNQPLYAFDAIYNLTQGAKNFDSTLEKVHAMLHQVIEDRKEQLVQMAARGETLSGNFTGRKEKFINFLDILLQSEDDQGKLTEDEVMDQVVTFFAAGQETVANSLSWTLYNLAQNKDWQDKCREEILEIIGDNEIVESSEESRMTTLTMCIKEAMRLYPTVHFIGRELTHDVELEKEQVTLEKGTRANVNIYALHHNPAVWETPELYDPSRFTTVNSSKRSPFAFIPFGAGPRICIGKNFAMHQMRVTLCHVLRKFEFSVDEECAKPEIHPCITLQIKDGIMLKVKKVGH